MIYHYQRYQSLLDSWTPYSGPRWISTGILILIFLGRVLYLQVNNFVDLFIGFNAITFYLGLVHYYLCSWNILFESVHRIPHS